jgi:predicted nucleic acid-binding protein
VLVETWALLRHRLHRDAAERFWEGLRAGVAVVHAVTDVDLELAWAIGQVFSEQDFSIVDRSSFAMMQRLGVSRAATFDDDFAVFRFGPGRRRAFEIVR